MLERQAAHQTAAQTGYFFRIKRHALLLGHFHGDPLQVLQNSGAADNPAAYGHAFDNAGFLTCTDLLELDTSLEFLDQVFDQIAEINSALGGKIKDNFTLVEKIIDRRSISWKALGL